MVSENKTNFRQLNRDTLLSLQSFHVSGESPGLSSLTYDLCMDVRVGP